MNVIGGSNPNFEYALDTVAFQTSPAFENLAAGNYTINVRDDKSCQFQKPIVLAPGNGNPTVFIPNVFTPNDDENDVNEVWNVSASCVKELNCQIFNRWGNLVHEITDPKGSWDGKDSAAGVYFYKLVVSSEGDKQENYHGYITLIR
jgi:gliding motility-associated-like protein